MNEREILSSYQRITDLLSVNRLKEALDELEPLVSDSESGEWRREKEDLDTTYKYMLQYTVEGIEDPERQRVYQKLLAGVYRLNDELRERLLLRESIQYDYVQKRILRDELNQAGHRFRFEGYKSLVEKRSANSTDYNTQFSLIFRYLWLTNEYEADILNFAKGAFEGEELIPHEKAALVSAINLSLWRYFDEDKFSFLFELYESEDDQIRYRALFGLLIAFYKYDNRLSHYPALRGRFLLFDEDPGFKPIIEDVVLQLIRSKDTENLTKRMQEEILPEMMKLTPQLKEKLDLDKLLKESIGEDQNPDWQDLFSDSPELQDKMEELTEMQMDGSDVFMSSFSMLKHFPFFNFIGNWFFPFTKNHPEIKRLSDNNQEAWFKTFIEAISDSTYMCNSDKFSFCYGIQGMPDDMKQYLSDGLKAESEQLGELMKDEALIDTRQTAKRIIRQYAQDIYRFFKLFPEKKAFEDLYNWKLDFHNKSFFNDLFVNDEKILLTIAGFYFQKKYYPAAGQVYLALIDQKQGSAEVFQKAGYCFQKDGAYAEALKYYLKADLLLPENVWNLKKIALCYRHLDQPDKALEYYRQADVLDPENLHTEVSIGHCLLEMKEFEEALKSYFKVEYLQPENSKVWRPIAWCSFVLKKFDQARKYYNKLIEGKPNQYDLMNLGHLEWCEGNRRAAVSRYRESIKRKETTMEQFLASFEEDQKYLTEFGVDPAEIPIMLDYLRYELEN